MQRVVLLAGDRNAGHRHGRAIEVGLAGLADLNAGRGVAVNDAIVDQNGIGDMGRHVQIGAEIARLHHQRAAVLVTGSIQAVAVRCTGVGQVEVVDLDVRL